MKIKPIAFALLTATLCLHNVAYAEDSEKETPEEEMAEKERELEMPQAVVDYIEYQQYLESAYPDPSKVDLKAMVEIEGERAALMYCKAIGFDGPCTYDPTAKVPGFVAVSEAGVASRRSSGWWWRSWLNWNNATAIGLLSNDTQCTPKIPYIGMSVVTIHMDDEDRRNANHRWGWTGGTTSGRDTTWRYCRYENPSYGGFYPLSGYGGHHGYAVLKLGLLCPVGARTIFRYQDNQDGNNHNWSWGNVFPNMNVGGRNWGTFYCYFESNISPWATMSSFPDLNTSYGVFASEWVPGLQRGYIGQDDEDFWNQNWWAPNPPNTAAMGGGRNTWWRTLRVR
jgi:hypothetical protein